MAGVDGDRSTGPTKDGFRALRLHATRHTWATFALQAGKSIRCVANVLGHADPALTLRVYAHAMQEEETNPRPSGNRLVPSLSVAELTSPLTSRSVAIGSFF